MRILRRLFRLFRLYPGTLLLSAVLLLFRAGVELLPPLVQKQLIDTVIERRDLSRLGVLIGALLGVYALQEVAAPLTSISGTRSAIGDRPSLEHNSQCGQDHRS